MQSNYRTFPSGSKELKSSKNITLYININILFVNVNCGIGAKTSFREKNILILQVPCYVFSCFQRFTEGYLYKKCRCSTVDDSNKKKVIVALSLRKPIKIAKLQNLNIEKSLWKNMLYLNIYTICTLYAVHSM